jgi:hypothetical protein
MNVELIKNDKKMKKILIFIFAVVMTANGFSQTAYQQKCHQIFIKYAKMFTIGSGEKWGQNEDFAFSQVGYSEDEASKGLLTTFMLGYCAKTGKSYDALKKQIEAEYAAARKLMTPDEKFVLKVNEESKVPYGRAKWQSAVDLKEWSEKSEFETLEQHQKRLQEQSRPKLDEFIYNNVNNEISENFWRMDFGDYNADKQELQVLFSDNNKNYTIKDKINVSPQNAKYLKSHCYSGDPKLYSDGAIQSFGDDGMDDNGNMKSYWDEKGNLRYDVKNDVLVMEYDTYELCVINNEIFAPRYFYISSDFGEWKFDVSENVPLVKFNYDDWYGKPQRLKGYTFDYQEYAKTFKEQAAALQAEREAEEARLIEQQRKEDSAAIAGFNAKIYETLKSYNQKLKDNQYNIKHFSIEGDEPMTVNDQQLFYDKCHRIEYEYEKYKKQIKDDYWAVKNQCFNFYDSTEEFDKYYCQGLNVLVAQTDYRNVMRQLEQNKASIAQVNFQKEMNNNSFMNVISEQPVDYTEINKYRSQLLEWVGTLKTKPYYDEVLDFLINNNSGLYKEYAKNGGKFSSKAEFYDAFVSGDYKNILKSKK